MNIQALTGISNKLCNISTAKLRTCSSRESLPLYHDPFSSSLSHPILLPALRNPTKQQHGNRPQQNKAIQMSSFYRVNEITFHSARLQLSLEANTKKKFNPNHLHNHRYPGNSQRRHHDLCYCPIPRLRQILPSFNRQLNNIVRLGDHPVGAP
jgi:hypothetical protein